MIYDLDEILSKQFRQLAHDLKLHGKVTLSFNNGFLKNGEVTQSFVVEKNGKEVIHNIIVINEENT